MTGKFKALYVKLCCHARAASALMAACLSPIFPSADLSAR
jgi:hypothetical protein